jgi:hypothetical protein
MRPTDEQAWSLGTAATHASDDPGTLRSAAPAGFPALDGAEERRMEDMLAARLFPRRAAPTRVGRYTILDRIGQGGMGVVYAAYDPELDRRVAIKLLGETLARHAEARLLREAQAMARVAHANVVTVIEVGVHEGQAFVVMEYLRGTGLERWRERAPDWRATLRVYVQAGRGLAAAHRAGVIHRDFKPHNAMLVEGGVDDGRVKVLDFGLARAAEGPAEPAGEGPTGALGQRLTRTGALMGTPAYMAPEQLAGAPASERSDQFSFAASLYEALYGQLPFAGETLPALIEAALAGAVRPPPAGAQVPGWVHRAVVRGLARAPADRFPSMTAMCDALERDPSARRRAVGLALALAAAVGAGGWGLARQGAAPPPCTGPAFELAEVWSEERAAAVASAFAATGAAYAGDAARRVRPALDAWAAAWTGMRREACEAHARGEQSDALLDLRMACLARRRAGFAALVGLLAEADAAAVARAWEAAEGLPEVAGCGDVAALTAETPPPEAAEEAAEVAALRGRAAEVEAQVRAGRLGAAASAGEATLARAEALGFAPATAEAALALGAVRLEQGRGEDAERALTQATQAGISGRADRVAAEALARRAFVRGALLADPARAAGDEQLATAYAARFPGDRRLHWLVHNNAGVLASVRGDAAAARERYAQALASGGATPLEQARTRVNLGLQAFDERAFASALAAYRAAGDAADAALGPAHPWAARTRMYEGLALFELGRDAAAGEVLAQVLARLTAAGEDDSPQATWVRIYLARLAVRRGDLAGAQALAGRAAALAKDPLTTRTAEVTLADATADADEAARRYAEALARAEADFGADAPVTAGLLRWVAAGLLRAGRAGAALPVARRWLAFGEAHDGATAATTAVARVLVAEVLLALGETDAALAAARASAAASTDAQERPVDVARAQWTLGRALRAAGDHDGASAALRAGARAAEALDPAAPERAGISAELARAAAR